MCAAAPVSHTPVPCARLPPHPRSLLQSQHPNYTLSCTGRGMVQALARVQRATDHGIRGEGAPMYSMMNALGMMSSSAKMPQPLPSISTSLQKSAETHCRLSQGEHRNADKQCSWDHLCSEVCAAAQRALFLGISACALPDSGTHLHWGSLQGSTPCGTACSFRHRRSGSIREKSSSQDRSGQGMVKIRRSWLGSHLTC